MDLEESSSDFRSSTESDGGLNDSTDSENDQDERVTNKSFKQSVFKNKYGDKSNIKVSKNLSLGN